MALWHEIARDDLKIIFKNRWVHVTYGLGFFVVVWGFDFTFKNVPHKEHQNKNVGCFLYLPTLPHLAMKVFSRLKD